MLPNRFACHAVALRVWFERRNHSRSEGRAKRPIAAITQTIMSHGMARSESR